MKPFLWTDTETYSETPIKNGVARYSEGVEVMIFAYAFGDDAPSVVDLTAGQHIPDRVLEALADPEQTVVFHNSFFDRTVLAADEKLRIAIPPERIVDTMVQAYSHGLPGKLSDLCFALGVSLDDAKDAGGKDLIQLFCKPRPANQKLRRATRLTHPEQWARFVAYAGQDIVAMRACYKRMPRWNYPVNPRERELWVLDQRINDRGVQTDLELAEAAVAAVRDEQRELSAEVTHLTDGMVTSATKRDAMLEFILGVYGVDLPDLTKATLERRLADPDIPEDVKELLRIRLSAATSSTAKYRALMRCVSSDGRARGLLQFGGAARTLRWAGRQFQPQNLSRSTMPREEILFAIEAIKAGEVDTFFSNVMEVTSNAIRGCLVSAPGRKLVVADLANIEGRFTAWSAGEQWKLQAFRDYDAGTGPDLYKLAYARSFGVAPESVNKEQRQIGKVQELALGYAGGAGAFATFATVYGIDLEDLAQAAWDSLPEDVRKEANGLFDWFTEKKDGQGTHGMSRRVFVTCDSLKRLWRQAHPATVAHWKELEDNAKDAINNPGTVFAGRTASFVRRKNWLVMLLPSGRVMCYPAPEISKKGELSYMGRHQYTQRWSRIKTFGGKLQENYSQAGSRDVLGYRIPDIERAGYPVVLSVHDELITEPEDSDRYGHAELERLMALPHDWAPDMPLAAAGFDAYRYGKE